MRELHADEEEFAFVDPETARTRAKHLLAGGEVTTLVAWLGAIAAYDEAEEVVEAIWNVVRPALERAVRPTQKPSALTGAQVAALAVAFHDHQGGLAKLDDIVLAASELAPKHRAAARAAKEVADRHQLAADAQARAPTTTAAWQALVEGVAARDKSAVRRSSASAGGQGRADPARTRREQGGVQAGAAARAACVADAARQLRRRRARNEGARGKRSRPHYTRPCSHIATARASAPPRLRTLALRFTTSAIATIALAKPAIATSNVAMSRPQRRPLRLPRAIGRSSRRGSWRSSFDHRLDEARAVLCRRSRRHARGCRDPRTPPRTSRPIVCTRICSQG